VHIKKEKRLVAIGRSLVANHVTEFKKKILLLDLLGKSEIKRQPIGNHGSGKNNSSSGKETITGVQLPRRDA
jgi:hypothetical protein